jgi:perosamine synthetase
MFDSVPANRHAWDIPARAMNLPSYHDMTDHEQDRVIAIVRRLLDK